MSRFDLLRAKYQIKTSFDKLFVQTMTEKKEEEETKVIAEMALDPKTENEIIVAEAFHTYWKALLSLQYGMAYEDMKDTYLNDMYGIQKQIEMIKAVQRGETDGKTFWKSLTPTEQARADVDIIMASTANPLGSSRYVGEQVGFKYNYLTAAEDLNKLLDSLGIDNNSPFEEFDATDIKQVRDLVEYANAFSKTVKENKVHHRSDRAMLVDKLTNRK